MSQKITEISDNITETLLGEFTPEDSFKKIDVEMIILGAVKLAYEQFLKDQDKST